MGEHVKFLLDRDDIRDALTELVERAEAAGISATVCIVGGAAIELVVGDRGSTRDIDAFVFRVGALDEIIAIIAAARGWPESWLNSEVSVFASDYDDPHGWNVLLRRGEVVVRVAPAEVLVAMKLRAGRGARDFDDLDLLLAHLGWSGQEAQVCFERFFPDDPLNLRSQRYLEAKR